MDEAEKLRELARLRDDNQHLLDKAVAADEREAALRERLREEVDELRDLAKDARNTGMPAHSKGYDLAADRLQALLEEGGEYGGYSEQKPGPVCPGCGIRAYYLIGAHPRVRWALDTCPDKEFHAAYPMAATEKGEESLCSTGTLKRRPGEAAA